MIAEQHHEHSAETGKLCCVLALAAELETPHAACLVMLRHPIQPCQAPHLNTFNTSSMMQLVGMVAEQIENNATAHRRYVYAVLTTLPAADPVTPGLM